uniref:Putative glycine rich secreted protein n=1 Tax=Hyalomma excavatum TaxID=257692 RepID=A0A131XNE3_9ACAR
MATIQNFLSVLGAFYVLSNVHAYAWRQPYCYRLVPLQITAVATPCSYPCLVLSRNVQPTIHVQQEVDGTPCTVPGMQRDSQWTSQCMGGVCLQPQSSHALKRAKRAACLLIFAAKKIIKKAKEAKDRKRRLQKIAEESSEGTGIGYEARAGGESGVGGVGALGGWPGSVGGQVSSVLGVSGRTAGMLQGARIGISGAFSRQPDGTFPRFPTGSYGGANAGPSGTFSGVIGGANVEALPGLSGELDGTASETPFAGSGGAQKGIRGS